MFFGLLRQSEVIRIKQGWIQYEEDFIQVNFREPTKTMREGFAFFVPNRLKPTFEKYAAQIDEDLRDDNERFLLRWTKSEKARRIPMGIKQVAKMAEDVGKHFNLNDKLTSHFVRRTSATVLANSGMTLLNLQRAGRWKSSGACKGYVDTSESAIKDTMKRLLPGTDRVENDGKKLSSSTAEIKEASDANVGKSEVANVYNNCTINIHPSYLPTIKPTSREFLEPTKNGKGIMVPNIPTTNYDSIQRNKETTDVLGSTHKESTGRYGVEQNFKSEKEFEDNRDIENKINSCQKRKIDDEEPVIIGYEYTEINGNTSRLGVTAKEEFKQLAEGLSKSKRVGLHTRIYYDYRNQLYVKESYDKKTRKTTHTPMHDNYDDKAHERKYDLLFKYFLQEITNTEYSNIKMRNLEKTDALTCTEKPTKTTTENIYKNESKIPYAFLPERSQNVSMKTPIKNGSIKKSSSVTPSVYNEREEKKAKFNYDFNIPFERTETDKNQSEVTQLQDPFDIYVGTQDTTTTYETQTFFKLVNDNWNEQFQNEDDEELEKAMSK